MGYTKMYKSLGYQDILGLTGLFFSILIIMRLRKDLYSRVTHKTMTDYSSVEDSKLYMKDSRCRKWAPDCQNKFRDIRFHSSVMMPKKEVRS